MSTRRLLEQRAATTAEMRAILAAAGDNEPAPEQRARFDALRQEADALQGRIERAAAVDDLERRMSGTPLTGGGTGDGRLDAEMGRFSIRAALAHRAGLGVDAGREIELSAELSRRAGRAFEGVAVPLAAVFSETRAVTSGGTGANLIATDLAGQIIDRLRPASIVIRAGARVLPSLTGNVAIPKITASPATAWIADGSGLTPADPTLAQVTLSPKTVGVITEYSRNLLLQSSPAVEDLIRSDLAQQIGTAIDLAAIAGTGASNQPHGILNTSGIGSVAMGTNGGALSYDAIQDLAGAVADANAEDGSASFIGNTKVRRALDKLKDSQGRPLTQDVVFAGRNRLWSNNVPATLTKGSGVNLSAILFGTWSDCLIGVWGPAVDLLTNPYGDAYARGGVQVRALASIDVAVRHAESFAAIVDAIA